MSKLEFSYLHCDCCYLHMSCANSALLALQAEARAHRIGQKNPVTIYKLVSQGTVEEQMMGRIQKKLYLSAKVTEAMEDIHTKFGSGKRRGQGKAKTGEDE